MANLLAITGCPTGVAPTFMAAAALEKTAAVMGHTLKAETQGSLGPKTPLSPADIAAADVVIVASDIHVDLARFAGKPIVAVPVSAAIRNTRAVIESALAELGEAARPLMRDERRRRQRSGRRQLEIDAHIVSLDDIPRSAVTLRQRATGQSHTDMSPGG